MEEKPKEDSGEAIIIVNNNDVLVNAAALVNDPFEEELQRRTQGLQTESQLLEFMGSLDGEWASQRKRRRIVPAGYFGDFLPRGWKIMLSLKRRAGHVWIICRRYISPDGRQFVSCKEVSSYLLSCFGLQEISNLDSSHTDGSLQFLGKMAPENGVGLLPTSDMKALNISSNLLIPSASAPVDHANQATLSSSIGSGEKKNSDENVNQDLVSGTKPGGDSAACGRMFTGFNHHGSLFIDERPLKANQNDKNAVQGCSPVDGKVGNEANEKLDEVHDVASRPDAHLDARNFSNNESNGNCEFIDEINAVKCMKSGSGNFVNQDGNTRCPETISCGNAQPFVFKSSGYELPVRLVEDFGEQIDFGSGKLPPNFEEKRRAADGLEDVNIKHGNLFENDRWLTNSGNCHLETEDVLNSFKLAGSSEGFSAAHSRIELKDVSVNSVKRIGGLDIDPNVKVIKDFNDDHTPHNEGVVTSFALETSSSKEQGFGCKIDSLFARSIEQNLVMPAGDEPPSAFDNNSNIAFSGTLDTLKTVEAACKNPPLDLVCCNNDAAADAYSTTSMIMGRSGGRVSSPLSSSIQNKFEGQGHDGVDNADKFCLTKVAKGDQVEVCENDEALLAFGRNQIESGVDMTSSGWKNV
ncbi:uncharacterized protein LOC114716211 [Neltuma alba]|nr:uncharacterized protein LOC114716211 [Prosopis alba]